MPGRHICARWLTLLLAGLWLAGGLGCASQDRAGQAYHPVWPAPPAQARVRHVMDIHSPDDLHKPSLFEGLGQLITGENRPALLKPSCVTLVDDDLLCVTDQQWQGLHMLHLNGSGSRLVTSATDELHFVSPVGVAPFGNLVAVSDSALNSVFLLTRDGKPAGRIDKPDGFARPTGLAYDDDHKELYVVDTLANEVCVFNQSGEMVRRFGSQGVEDGQFNYPTHVFVDPAGRVFITDSMNFRVQAFSREGAFLFALGTHGDASGYLAVPKGVGVDRQGHIYVADSYFSNVQVFDEDGRFLLSIGEPGDGIGQFQVPAGVFVDPQNRIFVCDSVNHRVQMLQYITDNSQGDTSHEGDTTTDR